MNICEELKEAIFAMVILATGLSMIFVIGIGFWLLVEWLKGSGCL